MNKVFALIPAAGTGRRMGGSVAKQYLTLLGKPILAHTLLAFEAAPEIDEIIPIVAPSEREQCLKEIVERYRISKVRTIVAGGAERQDSVANGIREVATDASVIVVHDGVRPFVTHEMIAESVRRARLGESTAVGVPPKDTIKEIDAQGIIVRTPARASLRSIQTPQTFPAEILRRAYDAAIAAGARGTDDAMLVERIGVPVRVIDGSYENIKITTPEDIPLAEALMRKRQ